jgi:hypothetical protein
MGMTTRTRKKNHWREAALALLAERLEDAARREITGLVAIEVTLHLGGIRGVKASEVMTVPIVDMVQETGGHER